MIKNFEPRLYQQTILNTAVSNNTLVVLPTGMGKTNIFLMLAAHRLTQYPNSKILFIGPTRPLIDQYKQVFLKHFELEEDKIAIFTGFVSPKKRAELWKTSKLIFSTPQGLENDIISGRINLEEVSLLGVDEAHRAVGDYAYVFVARQYHKLANYPRILALTASPGAELEKIEEVCKNLFIEDIEVRTAESEDVKQYIQEIKVDFVNVDLPPVFTDIKKDLTNFLKDRLEKLKKWGVLRRTNVNFVSKKDLLSLQAQIRGRVSSGEKDFLMWNSISVLAELMKIYHGLELLESQGIVSLHNYLDRLYKDSFSTNVKAVKNIVKDPYFKSALFRTQKLYNEKVEHPKLIELQKIVESEFKKNKNIKLIVFNQYRDNAKDIEEKLNRIENIKAKIFVGQQRKKDTGLSQKEQKLMLDEFREDKFNVLVATSIGEEGLDIPKVDLVIFYEPIPSAIRTVQRRGRTGRLEKGRVIMLIAKNTRDEAYRWSAFHKERKMHKHLLNLKKKLNIEYNVQPTLQKYTPKEEKLKIFADHREKSAGVIRELVDLGFNISMEKLDAADYLVSSRCGIELKTVHDFVGSIIDGRLLEQIKQLKQSYERPLIIIEGTEDIFSVRNVHANSIRGMLATITISYGIPIVNTKNPKETAALINIIAKREQESTGKEFTLHFEKKTLTLKEQQEYIVSSLPGVGAKLAKPLLKKFKTIKKIFNAKKSQLEKVDKIGTKKAEDIRKVLDSEYES